MKELRLKVKGIDTIEGCLSADNSSIYTDTIEKGLLYTNVTTKTIRVTNICDTSFSLAAKILFTQTDAFGSTFMASIDTTTIPANSFIDVPVFYNGTYKSNNLAPSYSFTINGSTIIYDLAVNVVAPPDVPGTITDFAISKDNRENHVFVPSDFTSHHTDADGDTVTHVAFNGTVSSLKYNGAAYVPNTFISMADVLASKLVSTAPLSDLLTTTTLTYKVKDSKNNIIS